MTTSSGIVLFFMPALATMIMFVFVRAGVDFVIYLARSVWSLFG